MDAVKYLKTKNRMTKGCMEICNRCELYKDNNGRNVICDDFEFDYPEEAVEKVRKWDEAHPIKTRAQVFFEKFPDAPRKSDGRPATCAYQCGLTDHCLEERYSGNNIYCEYCWEDPAPDKYQEWAN